MHQKQPPAKIAVFVAVVDAFCPWLWEMPRTPTIAQPNTRRRVRFIASMLARFSPGSRESIQPGFCLPSSPVLFIRRVGLTDNGTRNHQFSPQRACGRGYFSSPQARLFSPHSAAGVFPDESAASGRDFRTKCAVARGPWLRRRFICLRHGAAAS